MKNCAIEFVNFTFKYRTQVDPTLHDINLKIYEGEKVLIVGPSGSGKSTLSNCINGLIPHIYTGEFTGDVLIEGKSIQETSLFDLSCKVGTVLQDTDGQFILRFFKDFAHGIVFGTGVSIFKESLGCFEVNRNIFNDRKYFLLVLSAEIFEK